MLFVISDTHFFHRKIIKYADRPFGSVEEMNEYLIEQWNSVVTSYDTVIHCGDLIIGPKDISLERLRNIKSRLNGELVLVKGNHDWNASFYNELGIPVFNEISFPVLEKGKINLLTHKPPRSVREIEERKIYAWIHGHVHNKPIHPLPRTFNVSVENINYRPILLETAIKKAEEQD